MNAAGPVSGNKLAVFDIDGTLVQSLAVDEACFVRAFAEVLGIDDIDTDWARYDHVTDDGVTNQIVCERLGRRPRGAEVTAVRDRFVRLLREALRTAAGYRPVAGAPELLERLDGEGWAVALASGGWRESATVKLQAAALDLALVPGGFSEDGPSRESIVAAAVRRACEVHGCDSLSRIVCVGDGVWDVRTARRLGFAFFGVGCGANADRLRAVGAGHVVADFRDTVRFISALEVAEVPVSG